MASRASQAPKKTAGVLVPLFSVRTARSLGIGDIADLPALAQWLSEGGQKLVQLLPLGCLPEGETSPYSAATSFGIDPMYVAVDQLDDLRDSDRIALIGPDADGTVKWLRESTYVDYPKVRTIKRRMLRAAFERFYVEHFEPRTDRAKQMLAFVDQHKEWVHDWALFRALKTRFAENWWRGWSVGISDREASAVASSSRELGREVLLHVYEQWIAHAQWADARKAVNAMGVELMGDLPFMVGIDSADVWAGRSDFQVDATLGVPGDALAPDGQDWGLPAYDWAAMDRNDLAWVRRRSAAMGRLFDRFRVDHLVGYYRMYVRPKGGTPHFFPSDQPAQVARGEKVLEAIISSARSVGASVIAEDLGTIPPFVIESLTKLKLPGYKVLMWERDDAVFRDPATYPYVSLATSGTHDTVTLATWWEETMTFDDRRHALADISSLRAIASDRDVAELTPRVHDALLDALYSAGSELTLLPIQDLFGWKERVNVPGVTAASNWSYRLPADLETLRNDPAVKHRMNVARDLARKHGR